MVKATWGKVLEAAKWTNLGTRQTGESIHLVQSIVCPGETRTRPWPRS